MTSQINFHNSAKGITETRDCRPPENAPADYCRKLKNGIARLQDAIQAYYEEAFPAERETIARAVREAEKAAWATPFPSLFFPALAHLRVSERIASA
jgi:rubrerythrin